MELYQLKTFLAVSRCRNLTRASEQLHLSQPAVSKHIRALEDELGLSLFERTSSGMVLTRSGTEIFNLAEATLNAALALGSRAAQLRGEVAGTIRLGTIVDPESLRLGAFLARMLQCHPMIDIKLHHGISGDILRLVEAGELDAGFYLGKVETRGVGAIQLRQVAYVVIAPANWASTLREAPLSDLSTLPWVGPHRNSSQYRILQTMFSDAGIAQPVMTIEVDQEASMVSLVKSGVGLCLMREEVVRTAVAAEELAVWHGQIPLCPLSFIYAEKRKAEGPVLAMRRVLESLVPEPAVA